MIPRVRCWVCHGELTQTTDGHGQRLEYCPRCGPQLEQMKRRLREAESRLAVLAAGIPDALLAPTSETTPQQRLLALRAARPQWSVRQLARAVGISRRWAYRLLAASSGSNAA